MRRSAAAERRRALLKRGRELLRTPNSPSVEWSLRLIHAELDEIERGTWDPARDPRVTHSPSAPPPTPDSPTDSDT